MHSAEHNLKHRKHFLSAFRKTACIPFTVQLKNKITDLNTDGSGTKTIIFLAVFKAAYYTLYP